MLPATVFQALAALPGLQRGRTTAREQAPIQTVLDEIIDATVGHLPIEGFRDSRTYLVPNCESGRPLDLLLRSQAEKRTDPAAASRASIIVAHVRAAVHAARRAVSLGRSRLVHEPGDVQRFADIVNGECVIIAPFSGCPHFGLVEVHLQAAAKSAPRSRRSKDCLGSLLDQATFKLGERISRLRSSLINSTGWCMASRVDRRISFARRPR